MCLCVCTKHAHKLWNNNNPKHNINFWPFNTIENNRPTKLPSNKLNCDKWNMYEYWRTQTLCVSTCVLYINYGFGAKTNHFDSESIQWHRPQRKLIIFSPLLFHYYGQSVPMTGKHKECEYIFMSISIQLLEQFEVVRRTWTQHTRWHRAKFKSNVYECYLSNEDVLLP